MKQFLFSRIFIARVYLPPLYAQMTNKGVHCRERDRVKVEHTTNSSTKSETIKKKIAKFIINKSLAIELCGALYLSAAPANSS